MIPKHAFRFFVVILLLNPHETRRFNRRKNRNDFERGTLKVSSEKFFRNVMMGN